LISGLLTLGATIYLHKNPELLTEDIDSNVPNSVDSDVGLDVPNNKDSNVPKNENIDDDDYDYDSSNVQNSMDSIVPNSVDPKDPNYEDTENIYFEETEVLNSILGINYTLATITLLISILFIYALSKDMPYLLIPWMIWTALGALLYLVITIGRIVAAADYSAGEIIPTILGNLIVSLISAYFIWVVVQLYNEMKAEKKGVCETC